ncbi:MAG: IclR family transcriptional regulator C-terminal domain-containing protein, partial [Thermoplasmatota archaeon]
FTVTDKRALRAEILRVRSQGFAITAQELRRGYQAAAVPLRRYDGATIAAKDIKDELLILLPFGDVNGDGGAEMLAVDVATSVVAGTSGATLGAMTKDLSTLWSIPLDLATYPLNMQTEPFTPGGMADWTGDGVPDVVIADTAPYQSYFGSAVVAPTVQVLDGSTGAEAWRQTYHDVWGMNVLDDVTGKGGQDLFVVQAPGVTGDYRTADLNNATVTGYLMAGETGNPVVTYQLRPSGAGPKYSTYRAAALGDLDGWGGPEWGIRSEDRPRNPQFFDYDTANLPNDPVVRWEVFPGTPGPPPVTVTLATNATLSNQTGEPIVDVEPPLDPAGTDAARDAAKAEDAKSTPAPAFLLAVAAVALALAARRRKA